MEAIKILLQKDLAGDGYLRVFELWDGEVRKIRVPRNQAKNGSLGCRACVQQEYDFLNGDVGSYARVLCGRGAVQIQSVGRERIDLSMLASRLRSQGEVMETPFLLRFSLNEWVISIFADGRAIIQGTENPDEARKIYARWIGG